MHGQTQRGSKVKGFVALSSKEKQRGEEKLRIWWLKNGGSQMNCLNSNALYLKGNG